MSQPFAAPAVIEAIGLTKRYGGNNNPSSNTPDTNEKSASRAAVQNLHLAVAGGEIFGFLGENGAGKTTTIKMLTGLIPPTEGVARIAGYDVRTETREAKQRLGFIPDNPFLYDRLTGLEFLNFIGDLYGVPHTAERDTRAHDLLALFDLEDKAHTPIGGYSRGMRQKIALAAALLHEPRALFLDEPTVGLDPKGTRRLQDVLRAVASQGVAVFLSTHVLDVAADLCDRVGVLHKGRLVALGTPAELTDGGVRTLEQAFLTLTGGAGAVEEVTRLLGGGPNRAPHSGVETHKETQS